MCFTNHNIRRYWNQISRKENYSPLIEFLQPDAKKNWFRNSISLFFWESVVTPQKINLKFISHGVFVKIQILLFYLLWVMIPFILSTPEEHLKQNLNGTKTSKQKNKINKIVAFLFVKLFHPHTPFSYSFCEFFEVWKIALLLKNEILPGLLSAFINFPQNSEK